MNNYNPRVSYYIKLTYLHELSCRALTGFKKPDGADYSWDDRSRSSIDNKNCFWANKRQIFGGFGFSEVRVSPPFPRFMIKSVSLIGQKVLNNWNENLFTNKLEEGDETEETVRRKERRRRRLSGNDAISLEELTTSKPTSSSSSSSLLQTTLWTN